MKNNRDIINEFSRRTGIVDPAIDRHFQDLEETKLESVEQFSKRTGITDPRIDHFIGRQDQGFGIDWGLGIRRTGWWASSAFELHDLINYQPYPAQERMFRTHIETHPDWMWFDWMNKKWGLQTTTSPLDTLGRVTERQPYDQHMKTSYPHNKHKRGYTLMTGISAWKDNDGDLMFEKNKDGKWKKFKKTYPPVEDDEEADTDVLVITDEADKVNDQRVSNTLEELLQHVPNLVFGRGSGVCEAHRNHRHYTYGKWRQADSKLPPPPSKPTPPPVRGGALDFTIFED